MKFAILEDDFVIFRFFYIFDFFTNKNKILNLNLYYSLYSLFKQSIQMKI
jgi:hypothetical protein